MKKSDRQLGLRRHITRRDFIHDVGLGAAALGLPVGAFGGDMAAPADGVYYPPTRTGLRGSHPGAFEMAHALGREGRSFTGATDLDETYDLVVVGAGISGLAAAHFYRQEYGDDARILLLDNHDDFGGHAKRNEFHQGGAMRLAWGGTVNLEYPYFSDVVNGLMDDLGVDVPRLLEGFRFDFSGSEGLGPAIWFDEDTYGVARLLPGVELRNSDLDALADSAERFPVSPEGRAALKRFFAARTDVLADLDGRQREAYLQATSYPDFLREHFDMPEDAVALFRNAPTGYMGLKAENLSVAECVETGLPAAHVLGGEGLRKAGERHSPVAMFPDGNSSIARLLVRRLVPDAFPDFPEDADPHSIVTRRLDYERLDRPGAPVRLRLNSTVVHAANTDGGVAVSYVRDGNLYRVSAGHAVMACYNRIVRHLVSELPDHQKAALAKCTKRPLLVTNVLLRDGRAVHSSGVGSTYLPGSYLERLTLVTGIDVAEYRPPFRPDEPCVLQCFSGLGTAEPMPDLSIAEQQKLTRLWLLEQRFEDFERELRRVVDGVYGPHGLDVAEDILAITVNRWPHGYARDHLDLEDPDWNTQPPPNVVGRQRCGNIVIANSDAGADAYTHEAIDQAWRAVGELSEAGEATA